MDATSNHLGWHRATQTTGSKSEKTRLIFRQGMKHFSFTKCLFWLWGSYSFYLGATKTISLKAEIPFPSLTKLCHWIVESSRFEAPMFSVERSKKFLDYTATRRQVPKE